MDEKKETKPKICHLQLPSEELSVHSTRGIPLHTRYTKHNKILIKTFRDLLWHEVLNNLKVRLDEDVISVVVLYTFERTHAFSTEVRIKERRSLTKGSDMLSDLTPLNAMQNSNPTEDYEVKELVGRTLYGFDVHDSPYNSLNDPNPCEIMTDKGGIFLVPRKMSDWSLNQDGRCVALPVRYRFKHMIASAVVKSRITGPWLQLIIMPIKGVVPGTDSFLKPESSNATLGDMDSMYSFTDIDSKLINHTNVEIEIHEDDQLARDIALSYRDARPSVMVVLADSPVVSLLPDHSGELDIEDSSSSDDQSSAEEEKKERESASEPQVSLDIDDTSAAFSSWSVPVPSLENKLQLDSNDEESPGRVETGSAHRDLEDTGKRDSPYIIGHSESTQSVLEIGAGIIGRDQRSRSLLYNRRTPNPSGMDINDD